MPTTFQGTSSKPTTLANVADNKGLFSFPPPKPKSMAEPTQHKAQEALELPTNVNESGATLVALDPHGTFEHNTGSRLKRRSEHGPVEAIDRNDAPTVAAEGSTPGESVDLTVLANELAAISGVVKDLQQEHEDLRQELHKRDEVIADRDARLSELTAAIELLKQDMLQIRSQAQAKVDAPSAPQQEVVPTATPKAEDSSTPAALSESLLTSATEKSGESSPPEVDATTAPPPAPMPPAPTEDEPAAPAVAPTPASAAAPTEEKKDAQSAQSGSDIAAASKPSSIETLPELTMTEGLHKALYEFSKLYNRVEIKHRQAGGTLHPIEETLAKYHYQPRELAQVLYRNYLRTNDSEQAKLKVEEDVKQMVAAVTSLMTAEQVKEVQKEVSEKFAATPEAPKKGFLAKFKK